MIYFTRYHASSFFGFDFDSNCFESLGVPWWFDALLVRIHETFLLSDVFVDIGLSCLEAMFACMLLCS